MKRVFIIVLDSFGIGAMPDSDSFGDINVNTLASCAVSSKLHIPNLLAAGLGSIAGVTCLEQTQAPAAAYGRMAEASKGKDTTIGHWELAGIVSDFPLPTYPQGFPREVMAEFERRTGRGTLCNLPYSGSEVIKDYGQEHIATGKLIVYTSADSVFQIAAHEAVVPVQELYRHCQTARDLLQGEHGVGRVIARPFVGEHPFTRTVNRHNFSLTPARDTILDILVAVGKNVIGIGKIYDIFAGRGVPETYPNKGNDANMEQLLKCMEQDFEGLCFVNLVDFDMLYGH